MQEILIKLIAKILFKNKTEQEIENIFVLGCEYEDKGKVWLSEKYLLLVAEQDHHQEIKATAQSFLGILYRNQGKLAKAEKYLLRAAEQDHDKDAKVIAEYMLADHKSKSKND